MKFLVFAWLILTTTTLEWTNPSWEASELNSCTPSDSLLLHDLDSVFVYGRGRWATQDTIFAKLLARGLEGFPMQCVLEIPASWMGPLWVAHVDTAGNVSCPSNWVHVNIPPTSVPPVSTEIEDRTIRWYDVSGRRIKSPTHTGIYFKRVGRTKSVTVVVR